ncbi:MULTISPECIES: hypothetical protein [unclassified Streptomyces]|uniref:hypothetical protein n=1 Tax=unclassified Streptomyces TaxID=2593676 RepID=UPI0035DAFB31
MTTPIPDAATTLIRAVLTDEPTSDLLHHPERTALRIARQLHDAGWELRVTPDPNG